MDGAFGGGGAGSYGGGGGGGYGGGGAGNGGGAGGGGGSYTSTLLHVYSDMAGGNGDIPGSVLIEFVAPACYAHGTRILTDKGEVAVETLQIGDIVVTASGEARPIKWIGQRSYSARFARNNSALQPVCFKAGSLGGDLPTRDLFVSPKHAMLIDGALISAELLVNGVTIVKDSRTREISYFHVELDSHDAIVAEGAASETFADEDSRGLFQNAASSAAFKTGVSCGEPKLCAQRIEHGPVLEAARRRLNSLCEPLAAEAA